MVGMRCFSIMLNETNNCCMNLSDEDRHIIVGMELEKAENIFAEYEVLQKAGFWSTLVNRLYYSLFHAVSALLINEDMKLVLIKEQ